MDAWRAGRRYLRRHEVVADALFALLLYAGEAVLWRLTPRDLWPPAWPLALAWSALGMATVALRRRATALAVALLAVHTAVSLLVPRYLQVETIAIIALTYTAAARLPLRQAAVAAVALWGPALVLGLTVLDPLLPPMRMQRPTFALFLLMTVLLCVTAGRTVHNRRAYIAELEGRTREAERNQQALSTQAVAEERRRIARELHDMVAHHVSVMGVLATGCRRTLHRDPAAADEALTTIEETGRTALREMRRLLDVLRTDQEPAGELAPQPGLAHLAGLVEQVREAGLPVTLRVDGAAGTLDLGIALTVYRIVQEALTNALRHGTGDGAEVTVRYSDTGLRVEILDRGPSVLSAGHGRTRPAGSSGDRPGAGEPGAGRGLIGLRERVAVYGGEFDARRRLGGGYRVRARLPLERS
jgi:signal transduction histidine kinase